MCMRLPVSTLFPYTTLFRSLPLVAMEQHLRLKNKRRLSTAGVATVASFVLFAACHHPGSPVIKTSAVDRKSTPLNSSHANISYAVFCLKKKNYDHQKQRQII